MSALIAFHSSAKLGEPRKRSLEALVRRGPVAPSATRPRPSRLVARRRRCPRMCRSKPSSRASVMNGLNSSIISAPFGPLSNIPKITGVAARASPIRASTSSARRLTPGHLCARPCADQTTPFHINLLEFCPKCQTELRGGVVRSPQMRALLGFPNPVNEKAARVVAGGVAIASALMLVTGWYWLLVPLAYGFVAARADRPDAQPARALRDQGRRTAFRRAASTSPGRRSASPRPSAPSARSRPPSSRSRSAGRGAPTSCWR